MWAIENPAINEFFKLKAHTKPKAKSNKTQAKGKGPKAKYKTMLENIEKTNIQSIEKYIRNGMKAIKIPHERKVSNQIEKIPNLVERALQEIKVEFPRFHFWTNQKLINKLYKAWQNKEEEVWKRNITLFNEKNKEKGIVIDFKNTIKIKPAELKSSTEKELNWEKLMYPPQPRASEEDIIKDKMTLLKRLQEIEDHEDEKKNQKSYRALSAGVNRNVNSTYLNSRNQWVSESIIDHPYLPVWTWNQCQSN